MMRRHEFINEAVAAEILELIRQSTDPAALADRLTDYHDYDIAQALEQLLGKKVKRKIIYSFTLQTEIEV